MASSAVALGETDWNEVAINASTAIAIHDVSIRVKSTLDGFIATCDTDDALVTLKSGSTTLKTFKINNQTLIITNLGIPMNLGEDCSIEVGPGTTCSLLMWGRDRVVPS